MTDEELLKQILSAPRSFETERTRLEAPSLTQVPVRMAWAVAAHDELHFVDWWRRSTQQDVAERSAKSEIAAVDAGSEIIYNVFEKETNAYVGRIDLHSWGADAPRCEIGYMGDPRTQGRGLLREAARACVELAFALGCARIQAITDPRNLRSIAFAKALGMQEEGVLRNYERLNGELCDQVVLAVVRKVS
ncbi:MAG: GNAT family N-acetyltransferase [Casimicrobium sp.]